MELTPETLFIKVAVSEKPVQSGWFYVCNPNGEIMPRMICYNHLADEWQNHQQVNFTHYLRPITAAELLEWKRKIAGEAWNAGVTKTINVINGVDYTDKETYLSNIK